MGIKRKKNYLYLQLWPSVSNFTTSYNIFIRTGRGEKKLPNLHLWFSIVPGLKQQITSAARFRQTEGQTAYILIDREGNDGKGSVLGLLKVS